MTVVPGLVASQQIWNIQPLALGLEGDSGSGAGAEAFVGLSVHLALQAGGFHGPDAHAAPTGGDHGFDAGGFKFVGGREDLVEGLEERLEAIGALLFEDEGFGQDAVADAVLGRAGFSFGSDRSRGFCAIRARGVNATLGDHYIFSIGGDMRFVFSGIFQVVEWMGDRVANCCDRFDGGG